MRKLIFVATPIAALFMSGVAQATVTSDLRVIGDVVPASCTMNLTTPIVNYRVLTLGELASDAVTPVTPSMLGTDPRTTLNIVCDAPAQIAMNVTDNRRLSVDTRVATDLGVTAAELFGLGSDDQGTGIGGFAITSISAQVDSAAGDVIDSSNRGGTWAPSADGKLKNTLGWYMSWASSGGLVPEPVETVSQVLELTAAVVPTDDLNTAVPIPLSGSVTMELVYL